MYLVSRPRALRSDYVIQPESELNTFDNREIDTVRTMINTFVQQKVTISPGCHKANAMTAAA